MLQKSGEEKQAAENVRFKQFIVHVFIKAFGDGLITLQEHFLSSFSVYA